MEKTQLNKNFSTGTFKVGATLLKQILWYFTDVLFFKSRMMPFSVVLVFVLRLFGSKIGKEVRVKPGIHIKYPWKLEIGDYSWLADCYLENLDWIYIGSNCCISQQAMLITGNHNYTKKYFDLMTAPITIQDGVWIGAGSKVVPGINLGSHSVLSMGSVATQNLDSFSVYQGNPAIKIRDRIIS